MSSREEARGTRSLGCHLGSHPAVTAFDLIRCTAIAALLFGGSACASIKFLYELGQEFEPWGVGVIFAGPDIEIEFNDPDFASQTEEQLKTIAERAALFTGRLHVVVYTREHPTGAARGRLVLPVR